MTLGDLIKEYRTKNKMTMQDFADRAGLSKASISMLEKNKRPGSSKPLAPSFETYSKVAGALGLPMNDMLEMLDGNTEIDVSAPVIQAVRIPVYGQIPAGIPLEAVENILDWEEISPEATADGSEYIALKVQGTSMYPKYMDGDVVIVRVQPDCESGQDAVVYVNGYDATLKKVLKKTDCIILQPLNPEYEPMVYDYNDELNPVTILGVVKEIRRKV